MPEMTSYNTDKILNQLDQALSRIGVQDNGTIRDPISQFLSASKVDLSENTLKRLLRSLKKDSSKPDPTTADFVGLTAKNDLAFFNADNLSNVTTVKVKGLQRDESLVDVDFRPNTGQLFGVGSSDRLYTIDVKSGAATQVGTGTFAVGLDSKALGVDFNPVVDRIRVVSDEGQNLRLNPDTGAVVDANMMMDGVQPDGNLNGATDSIVATAYTNSFTGTPNTVQYGIDAETDQLFIQNPPNNGTQTLVGSLGVDFAAGAGFDIVFKNGTNSAFATSNSALYSIDLQSGAATLLGSVKDGKKTVDLVGIAGRSPIVKPDPTKAEFVGLTDSSDLVFFNSNALNNVTKVDVKGLQYDETLVGIDFRPNTGQLFGVGSSDRLYTIDVATGMATQVGTGTFAVGLDGKALGVDFNPVVDRIRVVSDAGQNLRLNPDTGAIVDGNPMMDGIQPDGNLNGATDSIVAAAYTNSFKGTTSTTLYGIDPETDQLFTQDPPNNGTQNLVGSLGVDFAAGAGFDIAFKNDTNSAFATSNSSLYSVNLQSGAATLLGSVKDGVTPVKLTGFAATGM
ncbi:MAG: DUF4394 domain-containing protein [Myxacorys californica WJT36-NPBG1]|jgi:3D (Asp-Asp-Asp) domain-containing protein|nr:DUF4394 domain-containing protein [Myxacorys californica WJT36-NPBG1]